MVYRIFRRSFERRLRVTSTYVFAIGPDDDCKFQHCVSRTLPL